MRLIFYACLCAFLFLQPSVTISQVRIASATTPAWVTQLNVDYTRTHLDKQAVDGYVDLEFQRQISLAEETEYIKYTKRFLSHAGVQNASEISVSFDPSYQKLIFHSVNIIRGGSKINKLNLSRFKITNTEDELDGHIYNGNQDALLILDDVRKGDILEYSYSRKGFNPVFQSSYSNDLYLGFSYPFYDLFYKIIVPSGRNLQFKNINQSLQPVINPVNGQKEYVWHLKETKVVNVQDKTPDWFDAYPHVLISEYSSWKRLNEWAMQLFPRNPTLSSELKEKIDDIKNAATTNEARIAAVIKFVQDDIRYMGIEMGEHSHKPAHPNKVFLQRFGDCKEKSYLAACMLWAMNIEADPVLINTEAGASLQNRLPSSTIFDHVTLRVGLNGSSLWFDPTISYQRGDIRELYYPNYKFGLVVNPSTTALAQIPFKDVGFVRVKNKFKVYSLTGGGSLTVTTSYKGKDADNFRDNYHNNNKENQLEEYREFYNKYFVDIVADSFVINDDEKTGVITAVEYYYIPNLWKQNEKRLYRMLFSTFSMNSAFQKTSEPNRKMPVELQYPFNHHEVVEIELPGEWPVSEDHGTIKNNCFTYSYRIESSDNIVRLVGDFKALKDHATVSESKQYFKDLEASEKESSYEVSHTNGLPGSRDNDNGKSDIPGLILIGAIAGGVVLWYKKAHRG